MKTIITDSACFNLEMFSMVRREHDEIHFVYSDNTYEKMVFPEPDQCPDVWDKILAFIASKKLSLDLR